MVNKVLGWIFSIVGLVILASGIEMFNNLFVKYLPFLEGVNNFYLIIVGAIVIIVGVLFLRGGGSRKFSNELPIFEGEGKKRRVVGYRRSKK